MSVSLKYKADEEYVAVNGSNVENAIDMLPKESKKAFSPMEMLLSSVAACAAVDIVSMIKKRRKTFVDLKAEASGVRRDEHPRKFLKIQIHYVIQSPDLTDKEAERIVELAVNNYCSVASSLDPEIDLTHSFTIEK